MKKLLLFTTLFFSYVISQAQNVTTYLPSDGLIEGGIYTILEDHNNDMWFGTWTGYPGLGKYDGNSWEHYTTADGLIGDQVWQLLEDNNNDLWIATTTGISKWDGTNLTNYTTADGLVNDFVHSVFQDNSGNMWFGTQMGISIFDGVTWTNFEATESLLLQQITSIVQDNNGDFWFGSIGQGVFKYDGANWINFTQDDVLAANSVYSMYYDSNNNLWVGTYDPNGGISKFDGSTWTVYTTADGLADNRVRAIHEDSFGDLWFGTNTGLTRYNGTNWVNYDQNNGLLQGGVRSIMTDSNNNLWAGHWLSGVYTFNVNDVHTFGVVGDATPNGWAGPDLPLSYNANANTWSGNVTLTDGYIKFRYDNNWALNYGDNAERDGVLELGGFDIPVTAGDYYIAVDLNKMTYKLESQSVAIPDANFEQSLIDIGVDSDGVLNGQILRTDALAVTELNLTNPLFDTQFGNPLITNVTEKIADLTGIEAFTNITYLAVGNGNLTSVNLSKNNELNELFLNDNLLTSIDVSKNKKLKRFGVMRNPDIGFIDVSNNELLEELFVHFTAISTLDVSKNTNLWKLHAYNTNLKGLDLSTNINLTEFRLRFNTSLTYLNVQNGNNQNVTYIDVRDTPNLSCITADGVTAPEVSQIMVDFSGGRLSIDCGTVYILDPNFELALIDLGIDASGVVDGIILKTEAEAASNLDVSNKNISDLTGLEAFVNLIDFRCNNNPLSGLDISKNTSLSILYCQYSGLNTLDVTNNLALTKLECEGNQLTSLDVTQNTLLEILGFGPNNLTEIDVSNNPELQAIWTNGNNLTSINLDANSKLVLYGLSNNPYNYVSLKNGNNANVFYFEANNTPSLDCINSDAVVSQSMIDSGKTFSEDCSTSLAGKWIIAPEAGSMKLGPVDNANIIWWQNQVQTLTDRACYFDDIYEFGSDGSFKNILGDETFLEPFQGVATEQCGTPVAPHDGSNTATYVYDQLNGTITLNGLGAYLGLPKVYNEATLDTPQETIPDNVTYHVSFGDNGNTMFIEIVSEDILFWRFKFIKESVFILDNNFEQALIDLSIDSDGIINNRILRADAEVVTGQLNVVNKNISDLTGIEAFVNITELQAGDNNLSTIDVTQNVLLEKIWVYRNNLTNLNLSANTAMQRVSAGGNQLTSIDLTGLNQVHTLLIWQNQLSDLEISDLNQLTSLDVRDNQLSNLDASANSLIETLVASNNNISAVNLGTNTSLLNLYLNDNPLTSLDITENTSLDFLLLDNTQITELNVSKNIELSDLRISGTAISSLDFSNNTELTTLIARNTPISSLNLSNNPNFYQLIIENSTSLKSLDIRNGNNLNVDVFNVLNTPNLTCINADGTGSPEISQVMIDSGKTFDEDCGDFVYIPDPNFELSLVELGIDTDGVVNTSILREDAEAVTELNLTNPNFTSSFANEDLINVPGQILDATGIEAFTNLTNLQFGYSLINAIDVSSLTQLQELFINDNALTAVDVSANTSLLRLGVMRNNITGTLDVSTNTNLQELYAHFNQIDNLVSTNSPGLTRLAIQSNNLTGLNLANFPGLSYVSCQENNISTLDISTNQLINRVDAHYNSGLVLTTDPILGNPTLSSLNLSGTGLSNYNGAPYPNLQWLLLNDNNLDKFNGNNTLLVENLFLANNQIGSLNLSSNTSLLRLIANDNLLTDLDVRNGNNVNLTTLNVTNNLLTCISVDDPLDGTMPYPSWSIDPGVIFSGNCKGEPEVVLIPDPNFEAALGSIDSDGEINGRIFRSDAESVTSLNVRESSISDLTGIEAFVNLEFLDAALNLLESVDLSENTKLIDINIPGNNLSELEIFSGSNLIHLDVSLNPITSIDLSDFNNLEILALRYTLLTELDLRNNPNLLTLAVFENPNLFCIAVDDPNNITFEYFKDDIATFSSSPDCVPPTIVWQPVDLYLNSKGEATVNPVDFDNGSSDNVSLSENLSFSVDIENFNCSNLGPNTIELTVIDEVGNFSTAMVSVNVIDDIAPTVSAQPTFTADLNGMAMYNLNPLDIVKSSKDNCNVDYYEASPAVLTAPGTYIVELTAVDTSGNVSAVDISTVEIIDSQASAELKFGGTTATIYPVPIGNQLNIQFSKSVNLATVSAQLLPTSPGGTSYPISLSPNNGSGDFVSGDTSKVLLGTYILQVTVGNKTDAITVVKD